CGPTKKFRPRLPNSPGPGAENWPRWAALKYQMKPVLPLFGPTSLKGVPSPRVQPVQFAVDWFTLLTEFVPAHTVNGRPLVTRPKPVISQPPITLLARPCALPKKCLPCPNGSSKTQFHCSAWRRSKSLGA